MVVILDTWHLNHFLNTKGGLLCLHCLYKQCDLYWTPAFLYFSYAFWLSGSLESWHVLIRWCLYNQFPINSLGSEPLITYIYCYIFNVGEECALYGLSKKGESIKKPTHGFLQTLPVFISLWSSCISFLCHCNKP